MGREGKALDIPKFLPMKGGDEEEHSGRILCWRADLGNDHTTSELAIEYDGRLSLSLWLTKQQWLDLSWLAQLTADSFRNDDDGDNDPS